MNYKTTVVLLCVLVVLGVALLFVDRGGKEPGETTASGEKRLFDVETKDVTKVSVTTADGKRLVAEKAGAEWKLLEPVAAPADTWAVDSMVRGLAEMKSRGQIELTAENASTTNLNPPRYQVEMQAGGKTLKLKVGSRSAIGDNLYVQVDGEKKAHVVSAGVYDELDKPFTSFRQMKLVTTASTDIKQIEITRPDGKLVLNKSGEEWQVVAPEKMPAEASDVSDMTYATSSLSAIEFVNESDVPPQLLPARNARMTVWFSTAAPATQPATAPATQSGGATIRFGGYDTVLKKNVYVSVSEPASLAKVAASAMDSYNKKLLDLRDRRVLNIDPAQVSRLSITMDTPAATQPTTKPAEHKEVVIERKKQTLTLGPEGPATKPTTSPTTAATTEPATQPALPATNWTVKAVAATQPADASQSEVESLLKKFNPLKVDKYLQPSAATTQPTATYVVEIAVQSAGGAESAVHRILLIDPGEGKAMIGQYRGLVFELSASFADDLKKDFANKVEPPKMPAGGPGMGMPGMGME